MFSRKPEVCRVDQARKYLQKRLEKHEQEPLQSLKQQEQAWLKEFNTLGDQDKEAVCCLSHSVHRKEPQGWAEWMDRPLGEKVERARAGMEELV